MSRHDLSDGPVATAQRADTRSNHNYGSALSPLAIPDRRASQSAFAALTDDYRAYAFQQREEHEPSLRQPRDAEMWMYPYSEQDVHQLGVDAFWTGPLTSGSPPDVATGTTNSRSNPTPNNAGAGGSGSVTRVAANQAVASSTTSTTTSTSSNNSGTYNTRTPSFVSNSSGGGATGPLAYQQNSSLYSFSSDLRSELEPLLQPPPTTVIPIAPVPLGRLPQQATDASYAAVHSHSPVQSTHTRSPLRSTLWWGELEPWMDEEYAKQVCRLMGWDPTVKIPHTPADPVTGQQANNPGYCFLTFPSSQHAAAVLSQVNHPTNDNPLNMPNSTKPFVMNWASSPTPSPATTSFNMSSVAVGNGTGPQQKEYSIFVGDLAPETSNSDLVAVFRNPVLGLRNDRAPKFIRPFYSCKSAKIMLDPVTGVSRGYGFVRFTDERDQQRALIEMHGLYCLSRPMRISPATAKFKTPAAGAATDPVQHSVDESGVTLNGNPVPPSNSGSSIGTSSSMPSLSTSTTASSVSTGYQMSGAPQVNSLDALAQMIAKVNEDPKQSGAGRTLPSITAPLVDDQQKLDESWRHQEQARAILSNLIGPNGEQLSSTDPYNTTVFVGGLSPLISEETLRTFFAPFGDIHYVKVPTGKHCGFVQFVRKADAERAIERMQGFPIGGSRIRLSWGRSQYKAAQAAAQAAASAQVQVQSDLSRALGSSVQLTTEQAVELLQKFGMPSFSGGIPEMGGYAVNAVNDSKIAASVMNGEVERMAAANGFAMGYPGIPGADNMGAYYDAQQHRASGFSPFSPDPNYLAGLVSDLDVGVRRPDTATGYGASNGERYPTARSPSGGLDRVVSPTSQQTFQLNRAPGRPTVHSSSRPASTQATLSSQKVSGQSSIHDFHGTVASLDLDGQGYRTNARSPGVNTDSSGSVQFRMSPSSSPHA